MSPSAPRHVLMTTDAVGGVWTYALDLSQGLAERGVGVTLAVLGPSPSSAQRAAVEDLASVALIDTGLPLDWLEDDAAALDGAGRALAVLAQGRGADLIHLNSPALAAGVRFPAPVVGACHSCLASWWSAVKAGELPQPFRRRTERLARGYAACDRLIAPSRAFAETTRALYGVTPQVVHNGRAGPAADPAAARQPVALTSGRLWDEAKNVATLDRAAAQLSWPVEAAGALEGPGGAAVRLEHIAALGHLSPAQLEARLSQTAVFVSLALYEPFGLGVLEAAQAGCALLLSDIPTFRELWDGAAVFVPPLDDAAAARALDALLGDADEARARGEAARRRAARFSLEAMVERTLDIYAEALAPASRQEAAA
jgi:glycosyltransferase involved in cell wall biosynthesis